MPQVPDGEDAPHGPEDRGRGEGASAAPGTGARTGRRRRFWLRWAAVGTAVVVVGAGASGWAVYRKLDGNITADEAAARELARYDKERPTVLVHGAQNILVIGSDSRSGRDSRGYGHDTGTQRSDTTILLHISADHRRATAVSVPRDLMVHEPACTSRSGRPGTARFTMFNDAFATGGTACTVRTTERLTGVRVDHTVVIDFEGFKKMVDAVNGVQMCIRKPIRDTDAHLYLRAGRQTLDGAQALGYVRARKSVGNGSDTSRMDRQQQFLGALAAKVRSSDVLLNPGKLYPVLDAATSSVTTDPGLASLRGLYDLVRSLRNIPTGRIQFLTVPQRPYPGNANRDQLVAGAAHRLFLRLRTDTPVKVVRAVQRRSGEGGTASAKPHPTFRGNTASQDVCR